MTSGSARGLLAGALVGTSWIGLRLSVGAGLRPLPPLVLDGALALWCWAAATAVTGRPLLGALAVAGGAGGLVLVDRVKRATVREPVVFADRAELRELLRHPGLYLPFAGTGLVLSGAALLLAAAVLFAWLEPPLPVRPLLRLAAFGGLAAVYCSLGLRWWRGALRLLFDGWGVGLEPAADMRRFGMLATFVVHATLARAGRAAGQARHAPVGDVLSGRVPRDRPWQSPPGRPIVLVQSESFFDVRRLGPALESVLPHYAALMAGAAQHGRLRVPCWGANTVRTEFAVLTGIDPATLGADRFNPYERFARAPVDSIAWRLRAAGYRTVCVHPFDTGFYGRRSVLPRLGFDAIVGQEAFARPPRGSFVPDVAVAEYVRGLLAGGGARLFVFVVTMQAHGPWRAPEPGGAVLDGYLRALHAADAALPVLQAAVGAHDGVLAIYGDHQPSLPHCQAMLGVAHDDTDYLVWDARSGAGTRRDLAAEQLGEAVCSIAARPYAPVLVAPLELGAALLQAAG